MKCEFYSFFYQKITGEDSDKKYSVCVFIDIKSVEKKQRNKVRSNVCFQISF